jgi:protein arginine N-methyltransferase 1
MYSVRSHAAMILDHRRVEAYQRALRRAITPQSVVLDIGTGLGIFALLACRAGARKVYAIESSEVISVAQKLAAVNGYGDRIEFIEDLSTRVTLPEPADVIVSDMGGAVPIFQQHLPAIVDARKRLMRPGGVLIPRSDTVWAGVVNAAEEHARIVPPADQALSIDMRFVWNMAANACSHTSSRGAHLLTAPFPLAVLDYASIEDPNVNAQITLQATRPGTGHGINLWFERTLSDGISFSTAPESPEMIYGSLFLPWPEAIELDAGDAILLEIRAELKGEDYTWCWNTKVSNARQEKCAFRQSDFLGVARSLARLKKQRASYVPRLNNDGEIERSILSWMDGKQTIEDIARQVRQQFPARFPTLESAIGHVGGLSQRCSLSE